MAIGIGLRYVQEALERKASAVQHEFIMLSDRLQELAGSLCSSAQFHFSLSSVGGHFALLFDYGCNTHL